MSVFLIGEIGSVHDGSLGNAKCAIDVAADCGMDAIKFQMHIAEAETLASAPAPKYFKGEPRMAYFRRTAFAMEQWAELKAHAEAKGLVFLCSPFSVEAVERLDALGMEQWKIPSGEVTNLPMLDVIAQTKKPVLLSSGMSSWAELDAAVKTVRRHHDQLTVLQCTTEYPCPYEQVGLNVMLEMRSRYGLPVGLSDHTLTAYAVFAAATLGATVVEKHFTFSRRMYGSDARHSMEPGELADLVIGVRAIETMLARTIDKADVTRFADMKSIFEKSLVSRVEIPAGAVITPPMLAVKKPGTGLPPARYHDVVGRRAARPIAAESVVTQDDIDWR